MKELLSDSMDHALTGLRDSARALRTSGTDLRNRVLSGLEKRLHLEKHTILEANSSDLAALGTDVSVSFRDRLFLDEKRIEAMCESLRQVIAMPDPVGEVVESKRLGNGLEVRRVRSPLGVILMIFESRPNVAIEAFSLALKSGNALILRGGKESKETTAVLYRIIQEAIAEAGLPQEIFFGITNPDRKILSALLAEKSRIDVVVPRGGDGLIQFVLENARMPIIKNDRGLCHTYVHEDAEITKATLIIENAKVQRPGVCNSLETLLIHKSALDSLVREMASNAGLKKVEFRTCDRSFPLFTKFFGDRVKPAKPTDYDIEYLDLILNVKVVDSVGDAIAHIEAHGSKHSEAVLTNSESIARLFQTEVDAAVVYWNASTRFTDGFSLGLGGELGISTQKLHVRGPVGLRELTSVRWIIDGDGQIR